MSQSIFIFRLVLEPTIDVINDFLTGDWLVKTEGDYSFLKLVLDQAEKYISFKRPVLLMVLYPDAGENKSMLLQLA